MKKVLTDFSEGMHDLILHHLVHILTSTLHYNSMPHVLHTIVIALSFSNYYTTGIHKMYTIFDIWNITSEI